MSTNKIFTTAIGSAVTFKDTDSTYTLLANGCANGAGRVTDQWDRGAGSLPARVVVKVAVEYGASANAGAVTRVYAFAASSSTNVDSGSTTASSLSSENALLNFALLGQNTVANTGTGPFYSSHVMEAYGRYVNFGLWNASGQAFKGSDDATTITAIPFADDIQAAS